MNAPGQAKAKKPGQMFLSWPEALEYEMRSSWLVFFFAGCDWKWLRRLVNKFLIWSFGHKYARYAAQKSSLPPEAPK